MTLSSGQTAAAKDSMHRAANKDTGNASRTVTLSSGQTAAEQSEGSESPSASEGSESPSASSSCSATENEWGELDMPRPDREGLDGLALRWRQQLKEPKAELGEGTYRNPFNMHNALCPMSAVPVWYKATDRETRKDTCTHSLFRTIRSTKDMRPIITLYRAALLHLIYESKT